MVVSNGHLRGDNDVQNDLISKIEPERKKGKWTDDGTKLGCCCDNCGITLDEYFTGDLSNITLCKVPNFCPNCGADMRGDKDDN